MSGRLSAEYIVATNLLPAPDRAAAKLLGAALRRVGYSEGAIARLLGDGAYESGPEDVAVHERRLPETRLATVVRLFFLELPVATRDAVRALGRPAVHALETTGLAKVGREVTPRARIIPVVDLLLASDRLSLDPEHDPPDYVATYTPTSQLCDFLTPRPRVARTLDVGTGNGVHALLAARHSGHVVATDVNARALAFTELNAALNELSNIECRRGGLFEPAGEETFDLITCNAPFVVSPESRWAYRDSGLRGDEFSERVVRGAAEHLADGGFATLLVSWVATDKDAPDEHVVAWVEDSGCDGWILSTHDSTPLDHAAGWNAHLAADRKAFRAALDEWERYFRELRVARVSEGAVLLHRRDGTRHTIRADAVDADAVDVADEQIQRAFAARARLAALRRDELLDALILPAAPLRVETDLEPGRVTVSARVYLPEGTQPVVETSALAAEVVGFLDGRANLDAAIQSIAAQHGLTGAKTKTLRRESLTLCRELLELGALQLV